MNIKEDFMSDTSDMSTEHLMGWVKDGQKNNPANRMAYGGVTKNGTVHLKTITGELITYSLHSDIKKEKI